MALQRLVHALGAESPATYPLLLPVLRLCTDPGQPDELNLLEDGLQLWWAGGLAHVSVCLFPSFCVLLLVCSRIWRVAGSAPCLGSNRPRALPTPEPATRRLHLPALPRLVALRNAPAPHPGLLGDLFPHLVAAMGRSTEHIAVRGR